jgi:hypothetical protein
MGFQNCWCFACISRGIQGKSTTLTCLLLGMVKFKHVTAEINTTIAASKLASILSQQITKGWSAGLGSSRASSRSYNLDPQ